MAALWTDSSFATAEACGDPEFECPIAGVADPYILRQRFIVARASYSALAMNAAHATLTDYKLVSESGFTDLGGGICTFIRTYAKVPALHNEYEPFAYNFIGFAGSFGTNVETATGRSRFVQVVLSKVVTKYFITNGTSQNVADSGTPNNVTITTPEDITVIPATAYYEAGFATLATDYLKDSPPYATATVPSRTTYAGYISTDAATASSYSLVAEPSIITRWMGQIYQRRTRYVKAL